MQNKILEEKWINYGRFQLFDNIKNRSLNNLEKSIAQGKINIDNLKEYVAVQICEYDQEVTLKKHLYSYRGPKKDFDKDEISKNMVEILEKFPAIKKILQSKVSKVVENNNQYDKDFDRLNVELAKLVNFSSLDDTYFSKLRTSIDDMKKLILNLSDLEQINALLHEDWIDKE